MAPQDNTVGLVDPQGAQAPCVGSAFLCPGWSSAALESWGAFERSERSELAAAAAAALPLARLDPSISNEKVPWAARRFIGQPGWERSHYLIQSQVSTGREVQRVPFSAVSRSWFSDNGKYHIRGLLRKRAEKLMALAKETGELPKLLTLTFKDVGTSWSKDLVIDSKTGEILGQASYIRTFMHRLKAYFKADGFKGAISYFWITELQMATGRAAIHFHIVLVGCPFISKRLLRGWWVDRFGCSLGFSDIRKAEVGEALYYATKYVNKSTGLDADVGAVALALGSSACRLRRYGASRDVSKMEKPVPKWIEELAGELDCPVAVLDWALAGDGRTAYVVGPDVEVVVDLARWGADCVWSTIAEFGVL